MRLNSPDYHLHRPGYHSPGRRYVLDISEDWAKETENWGKREEEKVGIENNDPKE